VSDPLLGCSDFNASGCCSSCHEDELLGYYMLELEDSQGKYCGAVCCSVWNECLDPLSDIEQAALIERKQQEKGGIETGP